MVALVTLGCEGFIDAREYEQPAGGAGGDGGETATAGAGGTGGSLPCVKGPGVTDFRELESTAAVLACWSTDGDDEDTRFELETSGSNRGFVIEPDADGDYWFGDDRETGPMLYQEVDGDFGFLIDFEVEYAQLLPSYSFNGAGIAVLDPTANNLEGEWLLADLARQGMDVEPEYAFGNSAWLWSGHVPENFQVSEEPRMQIALCRVGTYFSAYRRRRDMSVSDFFWGGDQGEFAPTVRVGFTAHVFAPPLEPTIGRLFATNLIGGPFDGTTVDDRLVSCFEELGLTLPR